MRATFTRVTAALWVAVLVTAGGGALAPAPAAAQVPPVVALYEKDDYGGRQFTMARSVPNLKDFDFGDTTSSATNARGRTAALYEHANYLGICEELDYRRPNFRGGLLTDNTVSSVQVDAECSGQAILYSEPRYGGREDVNCKGFECLLGANTPTSTPHVAVRGGSAVFDLDDSGNFDNRTSSILLPYGGMASLYSEVGFQGRCETVFGYIDDFDGTVVGNDEVSSVSNGFGCESSLNLFTAPDYSGGVTRLAESEPQHDFPYLDTARSFTNALRSTTVSVYTGPAFTGDCNPVRTDEHNGSTSFGSLRWGANCPLQPMPTLYLYPDVGYAGAPAEITASMPDLISRGVNDQASALVNSSSQTVSVYVDVNAGGGCLELPARASIADLSTTSIGNDSISSVEFGACPPPPQVTTDLFGQRRYESYTTDQTLVQGVIAVTNFSHNVVSLYRDQDYAGVCQNVPAGTRIDDLTGSVVGYQSASSLRVATPCPAAVQLFADPGYQGAVRTLTAGSTDLGADAATTSSVVNNTPRVVSVYSQTGYKARCQNLAPGAAITDLTGSAVGTDRIRSVRLGQPCRQIVLLFGGAGYTGTFLGVGGDKPDLSASGFARRTSALVNNTGRVVSVYSATNYTGRCQNIPDNSGVPNLAGSVVHDNAITSIRFAPCPPAVSLFRDVGFAGEQLDLTAPKNELSGTTFDNATESVVNNSGGPVALYSNPGFLGGCELLVPGQALPSVVPIVSSIRAGTC